MSYFRAYWYGIREVIPERRGDGKLLKDSDGIRMAFQVRFGFVIEASILVWSWYGEGGGGLAYGFPWFVLDCFIHEIPHGCSEYGSRVTG